MWTVRVCIGTNKTVKEKGNDKDSSPFHPSPRFVLLFSFTDSSNHKPGRKDKREENEDRYQHYKRIPYFSQHVVGAPICFGVAMRMGYV